MDTLIYSDVHHDDYTNGLTLDDTVAVEDAITQYAINNNISNVLFLGDWYRATNPTRKVIAAAEESWKKRSDQGITTIVLVGNHDRWTKSALSGHSYISALQFTNDLKNIHVVDKLDNFGFIDGGVKMLAIPSGFEGQDYSIHINPPPDIVLFHALVTGSMLAHGGSVSNGIAPEILFKTGGVLMLGGDNHTPQDLSHVVGAPTRYVGAPLQHNWNDRGQDRGFLHLNWTDRENFVINHVSTRSPQFVRINIPANNEMEAVTKIYAEISKLNGPGIFDITLIGKNVGSINIQFIEDSIRDNVRRAKINVDRTYEKIEVAAGISEAHTPEDKWSTYVSGGAKIGQLNPSTLAEMGKWAIQEARKVV